MTNKILTIKLAYSNGKKTLGYDYFSLSDPTWEDKMQERGRAVGAKFAHTKDKKQVYGIKYDDKHSDKRTEMNED